MQCGCSSTATASADCNSNMVALTTKVLFASCLVLAIGIYFYPRDDDSFDYFKLSLQWPASLCDKTGSNKCSRPVPDYFTIHGLWAQKIRNHKHKPYNCQTPNAFNYNMLKKDEVLMKMMNKSWPSLVEIDLDMIFWKHEWEKHGICTFKSQQKEYFKNICAMSEKASLLEVFKAKNITPGDQTYLLKQYNDAIEAKLKVKPGTFKCEGNENDTKRRLVEVKLCTDKGVTKFVHCTAPEPKSPSCGKVDDCIPIAFPSHNNKDDEVVFM